jgi:predicted nucleic acid-binding protein
VSRFVVDASVVLAWCFPDENSTRAVSVARMFQHGDSAIAPSFWPHEVLNALLVGEKRKRIPGSLYVVSLPTSWLFPSCWKRPRLAMYLIGPSP